MDIGTRLRAAREARKLTVRGLAQRTGFSPSFLSQVELGQCSPSLASLQKICVSLEIEMPELLRDPARAPTDRVVRKAQREAIRSEWSKASAESLWPHGHDDRFSAMLLTLDPGGRTGSLPGRGGAQGFVYCIRGKVVLTLGEERHELATGDTALLDYSDASWENQGRSRCEVLVVSVRSSISPGA